MLTPLRGILRPGRRTWEEESIGILRPGRRTRERTQERTQEGAQEAKKKPESRSLLTSKKSDIIAIVLFEVPRAGVEPARLSASVFETDLSTDSNIWACREEIGCKGKFFFRLLQIKV